MYLYRNCLRRYTKCVAFLELDGIKKKLSSLCQILAGNFLLLYGPFPEFARVFALYAAGVNVQAVRNIDFSYFINLIRNSSTLRPLELDVHIQPTFCRFSFANEHEHMSDRSMLVLYPASTVVSSVVSLCFICVFKEYTLVCLCGNSRSKTPMPSEFQS